MADVRGIDPVEEGLIGRVQIWLRDHRLAGNSRAGAWSKRRVRLDQLAFARRHWLRLTIASLIAAVVIGAVASRVAPGFWRGLVIGALGTTVLASFFVLVMQATGSAPRAMGAAAGEWIAGELRWLRRRRWALINHFGLGRGDIDHVLVGRAAIVVAETKWSADGWELSRSNDRLQSALAQVKTAARSVRLWTGADQIGLPVRPVLVLWGGSAAGTKDVDGPVVFDDVTVLLGLTAIRSWRDRLRNEEPVAPVDAVEKITAKMREHLSRRDVYEAADNPAPPSFERMFTTAAGCSLAAIAGSLALLYPLTWGWRLPVLAIAAGAIAGGLIARRFRSARYFADAWLAGVAGMGLFALLAFALAA